MKILDVEIDYSENMAELWQPKNEDDEVKQETAKKLIDMNRSLRSKMEDLSLEMKSSLQRNAVSRMQLKIKLDPNPELKKRNEKLIKLSRTIAR